jgi:DNA polymerase III epsilon subunit family exonuclease
MVSLCCGYFLTEGRFCPSSEETSVTTGLAHSIFQHVLFPKASSQETESGDLQLRRAVRFQLEPAVKISEVPLVVFDFETTGLDFERDRIIEIGALKIVNGKAVDEISTLVHTDLPLSEIVVNLTGITPDMLKDQPRLDGVLPDFLRFIQGCVLVAHNAEFDYSMLKAECSRQGIDIEWPVFCTLKLARELLPELERKTLDSLAQHYGLEFEARHRSIGDVKVTVAVLNEMLSGEGTHLESWRDLNPYSVS